MVIPIPNSALTFPRFLRFSRAMATSVQQQPRSYVTDEQITRDSCRLIEVSKTQAPLVKMEIKKCSSCYKIKPIVDFSGESPA